MAIDLLGLQPHQVSRDLIILMQYQNDIALVDNE